MIIDTTSIRRGWPPLPRAFVRGFLSGALVVRCWWSGWASRWRWRCCHRRRRTQTGPWCLKAGDCRYSGSMVGALRITDRTAGDLADTYARLWSGAGWNVTTQVSGQYAVLTATRAMMTYTVDLFQQGQLVQAVSNGRQCEP